jgi:hypothetical protein
LNLAVKIFGKAFGVGFDRARQTFAFAVADLSEPAILQKGEQTEKREQNADE